MTWNEVFVVLVLALATQQAVEIWRHGSIFADTRAWIEVRPFGDFLTDLLLCPFCLSVWVAAFLLLAWHGLPYVGESCAYVLAISRLANWTNDTFHSTCRTPNRTPPSLSQTE